ncbi:MAG: DUF1028 domain-containing protein [Planctomycetaceae bacterium]|nr:DUF1028 domain-containing protein [Planctomycetaceae bacterium]
MIRFFNVRRLMFRAGPMFVLYVAAGAGDHSLSDSTVRRISTPTVATFSIVACDPETGELGIAVQSRLPGVGAIVPFARAGVGAIATQAYANTRFGPEGLKLLSEGKAPEEVMRLLTAGDLARAERQFGIVDARGRTVTFTGDDCLAWAGSKSGPNYVAQGNILAGPDVVEAMGRAFEATHGELALRLLAALDAGQQAGGDRRGMQSAALLIVREGWGYDGQNDRFRDLRVDDHDSPIRELRRVYEAHTKTFPRPRPKPGTRVLPP